MYLVEPVKLGTHLDHVDFALLASHDDDLKRKFKIYVNVPMRGFKSNVIM